MAANSVCTSCLRTMRQQVRCQLQTPNARASPSLPRRTFTSSIQFQAEPALKQPPPPAHNPYATPQQQKQQQHSAGPIKNLAAQLRNSPVLRSTTEPYIAYGGTEDLFLECSRQCSYTVPSALQNPPGEPPMNSEGEEVGVGSGWWLEAKPKSGLGLPVTFNTWAHVMFLHMWLLTVRFRCFPKEFVKDWDQHLLDHFFYAAEDRMATWHRMSSRGVRNRYLKDLWTQWRGVMLSYDEGLIKGDAVLAAAVWRNVFKADEGVDIGDLAVVTAYMTRELKGLSKVEDHVITEGRIKFGDPKTIPGASTKAAVGAVPAPAAL